MGGTRADTVVDLHHFYIALVFTRVGHLVVLAEEGDGSRVLAEQEVAFGLGEQQLVVAFDVRAVAEGGETVLVSTVLEEQIPRILMDLLILRS
jgi:hypothetical protein